MKIMSKELFIFSTILVFSFTITITWLILKFTSIETDKYTRYE